MSRVAIILIFALTVVGSGVYAQSRRPQATVTPSVPAAAARPGGEVKLSLRVQLPDGVHVQSNKPRDPAFIPTALTLELPAGVTTEEIAYPAATDLRQAGQKEPLAVFGHDFVINVRVKVGRDVAAGDVTVPGRLRYQACDDKVCYPPARVDVKWVMRVSRG